MLVGHLPATRRWERGRPGPPRAVRERGRRRHPERPAVRHGSSRRTPACVELDAAKDDFLRGISHNLQTPLDEHPRLRRAARRRAARPPARRSSSSRPTGCRGWSASCSPCPASSPARCDRGRRSLALGAARPHGRGRHSGVERRRLRPRRSLASAGWPSPTPTSSTRSCGPCSTTRSSTARGAPIDVDRRRRAGRAASSG